MSTPRQLLYFLTENYSVFYEPTLLEIGIHEQIKDAVGDAFSEKTISKLMGNYTNCVKYNASVVEHLDFELHRVNLDGSAGSLVSDESKRHHVKKFLAALKHKELKKDVSRYADLREQAVEWVEEQSAS